MTSGLRPYQAEMVDSTVRLLAGGAVSICWQVGTGAGKTHTAAEFLLKIVRKNLRGVFFAHLSDLILDTHARLQAAGVPCGFIQAGRPSDPTAPIQVCSLQTIHSRGLDSLPPARVAMLDEAHRCQGATTRAILEAYPGEQTARIGLTATPQRGDGKPLGELFKHLVQGPSNRWLTDNGYLVPCEVIAPGDPKPGRIAMDPVKAYNTYSPGRRAIIFAESIEHARDYVARLPRSALFVGETDEPERVRLKRAVKRGEIDVLVGVAVFVEGFDLPELDTVILARQFTVTGAYLQAIGRGLRPAPWVGKTKCRVIDLFGSWALHGLPDEERRWSLEGVAVRRAAAVVALCRCSDCFAIFPAARECPRCGTRIDARTIQAKKPRKSAEQVLETISAWPEWKRDARVMAQLRNVAMRIPTLPAGGREAWCLRQFRKRFDRLPTKHPGDRS